MKIKLEVRPSIVKLIDADDDTAVFLRSAMTLDHTALERLFVDMATTYANGIGGTGHMRGPLTLRLLGRVKLTNSGCWEFQGGTRSRVYGTIRLKGRPYVAHRFVYELLFGRVAKNLDVCHKCDNPPCIAPSHLFVGTRSDNMQDAIKKGRKNMPTGEAHKGSKLSLAQVVSVPGLLAAGLTKVEIAKRFGVTPPSISAICKGRIWKERARGLSK